MNSPRILLGPDIIVQRESISTSRPDIGILFRWLDLIHSTKCVHPLSVAEIKSECDLFAKSTVETKLESYVVLKTTAPDSSEIRAIGASDATEKARANTALLNEVYCDRVNFLITENRSIHQKAARLAIDDRVYTISEFLEKLNNDNPPLLNYKVLAVKQELFGNIDISDDFFDSFRRDYQGFDRWFNRKADETAYVCKDSNGKINAFLYIKVEDNSEYYPDIQPPFLPKRRLKIGTFKVTLIGYTLGERLLKIAFDNALAQKVDEIYLTIFNKDEGQERLIALLASWGFKQYAIKRGQSGDELVLVRDFSPVANVTRPSLSYPFISQAKRKYIVAIYPEYHTELLPDSILKTEHTADYIENKSNRNALKKVFISRSYTRSMSPGDIIVFYRTAFNGPAHYTAVVTTLGVVESVITNIQSEEQFFRLCKKRSVFTDEQLREHWNYKPHSRPFVVNFLYIQSLPAPRLNLLRLKEECIIQEPPRGFDLLSDSSFNKLIELSHADQSIIVN